MAEYIEREGLMHELGPYKENNFFQEMSVILQIVAGRPAADVAPVVHGRWKYYHKQGIAVCTSCSLERKLDDNFGRAISCPNCGAKMDKEES